MTIKTKTKRAYLLLVRNADRYHYRQINHEQHSGRNRSIWHAIVAQGDNFQDAVLALLRGDYVDYAKALFNLEQES